MHHVSQMCVEFCDDIGVLNDPYLWLLYENCISYCSLHPRGSKSPVVLQVSSWIALTKRVQATTVGERPLHLWQLCSVPICTKRSKSTTTHLCSWRSCGRGSSSVPTAMTNRLPHLLGDRRSSHDFTVDYSCHSISQILT